MQAKSILILGVGNTLLSDEGFGVHALEYLRHNYIWPDNIRLVDGATGGMLLMSELMECDLAVILDIALAGGAPGSIYLLENDNLGESLSFAQSMHQTNLNDILISCDLAGKKPETAIFAMEPFDWQSLGINLTPQAQSKLNEFCEKVVVWLAKRGLNIKPISE